MGKSYEQQMQVPFAPEAVAQRAQQVISAMPKVKGLIMTPPIVQAKVGAGFKSWGEKITVHIAPIPGGTAVNVRSECAMPTQLVDYGKNQTNVEYIIRGLTPPPQQ